MSRKIFISHHYQDLPKVNLLRAQLANSSDINLSYVDEGPLEAISGENIAKSIDKQITGSSMMLVMLGSNWSKWQEYEVRNAVEKGIPVVGLLAHGSEIKPLVFESAKLPVVGWNWNELSKILAGEERTLDFKEERKELFDSPIIQIDFAKISEELTSYLLSNPDAIHTISPRKFEELVAYLMEKHGYEVTLTQQSRDGGVDIFALKSDQFGKILTIVDCKKYSTDRPVGVDIVRGMYGTLQIQNASHGVIATTSRFTRDASNLAEEYKYQLSLKDHADILKWIQQTKI